MSVTDIKTLNKWEWVSALTCLVVAGVGVLTISRTFAPEELLKKLDWPATLLGWTPLALVATIWLSDFVWRVEAVVWLQTVSCTMIGALFIVFGASGVFHVTSNLVVSATTVVVSVLFLAVSLLFARGFYQRREWARRITLQLSQLGVIITIVTGLFWGIKASEMWSTLDCAVTWYWLSRPELMSMFAPKAETA
jgi:hypothetical protein